MVQAREPRRRIEAWTPTRGRSGVVVSPLMSEQPTDLVDPDPFSIGLGLPQIISAGASFLEARRQRQLIEQGQAERFRSAWFLKAVSDFLQANS